jgi:transposase
MFAALTDRAGVTAHRRGALERVQLLLEDWQHAHRRLADTETRSCGTPRPRPSSPPRSCGTSTL